MTHPLEELIAVRTARDLAANGQARALRESANLSLREIASAIGVDHRTVSRWERGESRPTDRLARRYAAVLQVLADGRWGRS